MDSVLHSSSERPCAESFVSVNSMLSLSSRLSERERTYLQCIFHEPGRFEIGKPGSQSGGLAVRAGFIAGKSASETRGEVGF